MDERDIAEEYWGSVRAVRSFEIAYDLVTRNCPRDLTAEQRAAWLDMADRMRAMLEVLNKRQSALMGEVLKTN